MTRLVISADSSPQYYSFYLAGFEQLLGQLDLSFSVNDLPRLIGPRDGMALVLPGGRKVFVAADDHPTVNDEALAWCDVYGQANLDPAHQALPGGHKLVAIGPGFGIRWHGRVHATRYVLGAWRAGGRHFAGPAARWRALIKHQRQRLPLSAYQPGSSDDHSLFFLASYWHKHPQANTARIELCNAMRRVRDVELEGGFVGAPANVPAVLRAGRHYSMAEYLDHTTRSVVALNTPAVHDCFGWKLGEFFALGKAIVSLPLTHPMPGDFEPGVQAVIVASADAAVDAVDRLVADAAQRRQLELNARRYFDEWLSPLAVAKRLASEDLVSP